MTITTTTLTRAAGIAAIAGGLIFIVVQINHPLLDAAFTTTAEYTVRETARPRLQPVARPAQPRGQPRQLPVRPGHRAMTVATAQRPRESR